jgi:hypothetical protein
MEEMINPQKFVFRKQFGRCKRSIELDPAEIECGGWNGFFRLNIRSGGRTLKAIIMRLNFPQMLISVTASVV